MKRTNIVSLFALSGLLVSCGGGKSMNIDKTFDAPGGFNSMISKEQDSSISESEKNSKQKQNNSKLLAEEEIIKKKKLEYLQQLSDKGLVGLKCNSTGCASISEEKGMINTDYFVNKDSIKPFKPDATLSGITTYKADTIVKAGTSGAIRDYKGKMDLNIDNRTGMGNAITSIQNVNNDIKDINIKYNNIDYTKEKFNSNDVTFEFVFPGGNKNSGSGNGSIEGSLSGKNNSSGKFNFNGDVGTKSIFDIKGVFNGNEKEVDEDGCIKCNKHPGIKPGFNEDEEIDL